MKLNINFRNIPSTKDMVHYIDHRLSFAFSRTRHNIEKLSITIADINGPKGGIDKQCRVVVKPAGLRQIVISCTSVDIRQAIDQCMARASQSLNRRLEKRKLFNREKPLFELAPENLSPT